MQNYYRSNNQAYKFVKNLRTFLNLCSNIENQAHRLKTSHKTTNNTIFNAMDWKTGFDQCYTSNKWKNNLDSL